MSVNLIWLLIGLWNRIRWGVTIVEGIKGSQKFLHETFPNQLVELVKQAHAGLPFKTVSDISVGADMRQKLIYPLTPELVELIKATTYYNCQWKKFSYKLAEYDDKDGLSGTVLATIRFQDNSRNINLDYMDVPIYIVCRQKSVKAGRGFYVFSVDYPQQA